MAKKDKEVDPEIFKKEKVLITMDPDIYYRIKIRAAQERRTMSSIVEELVREYLINKPFTKEMGPLKPDPFQKTKTTKG